MKQHLDVILLAGGESVRFWPFFHKNLSSFLGKPLLVWHLDQFVRLGLTNIVIVGNKESIESLRSVPVPKKLTVTYAVQKEKGQGYAAMAARDVLELDDRGLLILNASDIYDDDLLMEICRAYEDDSSAMYQGAVRTTSYFPGGYFKLNDKGTIVSIVEKPKPGTEPSDLLRIVADIIPEKKPFFQKLEKYGKHPVNGYEGAINKCIEEGIICNPVITTGEWLYLKYPWHMLSVMDACLRTIEGKTIASSVHIAKNVVIEGPVIIEDDVRIFEGTKIVGPCFIGRGTIIGNNNMIRGSHIGSGCVTGFNTDITRSYIGDECWFHSNFIGDSVIGKSVSMGSGTVLANLRLDESPIFSKVKQEKVLTGRTKLGACIGDGVRIGVNASIMPGVKIGKGAFIGAGVIVGEDVPEATYCRMSPTVIMGKNTKTAPASRDAFRKKL